MNDEKQTILLVDEDGVECEFEISEVFGVDELNSEYAVVIPVDSEEEEGILLKMIEEADGSMTLATIEDEEEYDIAAEVYATLFMNEDN
ncbi:DUF1292 domain-containing protein [Clostridium frigidicarnis]|uniref:UPF0473 protein SAMN04488528_1002177 n=1 Tax=Clostridium frigidicarnis TaxID=84698 RepID=A0A1I0VNV7_9CLOT|nr:DUF1292 domain-containing protein [Clostridium frigidicarnis]SFA77580.1 Protein of unknown function [Clostridium frigidicarnis]